MVVEDTLLGFVGQRRKGDEGMVEIPVRVAAGAANFFRSVDQREYLEKRLGAAAFLDGLGRENFFRGGGGVGVVHDDGAAETVGGDSQRLARF